MVFVMEKIEVSVGSSHVELALLMQTRNLNKSIALIIDGVIVDQSEVTTEPISCVLWAITTIDGKRFRISGVSVPCSNRLQQGLQLLVNNEHVAGDRIMGEESSGVRFPAQQILADKTSEFNFVFEGWLFLAIMFSVCLALLRFFYREIYRVVASVNILEIFAMLTIPFVVSLCVYFITFMIRQLLKVR